MSKTKRIISSSLVVALLIIFVSSLVWPSSSYAYPDGLLDSKIVNLQTPTGASSGTTTKVTDNIASTSVVLNSSINAVYFTFSKPMNISAYQVSASSSAPIANYVYAIDFIDSNGVSHEIRKPVIDGTKQSIETVLNVVKVIYVNYTYQSNMNLAEFDVFGAETPTPTVEPILTPGPTISPVPSPTVDPTPELTPVPTSTPNPEIPSGARAILTITLTTGLDKEFDLPITEVNAFLNWYDSAAGSTRYGIDKHNNNKGPFSKRTEYVIHDKILTFEVSEYTAQ
ncbi:hypothetical protein NYE24_30915 [Paenibacillus sp. FSL H7-0350]|uniref:hypothetical protein n=1 Tax=Paenibacillus sp. FSL H7-0350 TaxID=2975345 RepID=UPI003158FBA9